MFCAQIQKALLSFSHTSELLTMEHYCLIADEYLINSRDLRLLLFLIITKHLDLTKNVDNKSTSNAQSSHPECHCAIDSTILVATPKYLMDGLNCINSSYWHLVAFEHFDQNANASLFFTPFEASLVPENIRSANLSWDPK